MTRDHSSVWDNCLQAIRKNVNQQSFKTWFEPIKPVRLDNNALTIQVLNKFLRMAGGALCQSAPEDDHRRELGDRDGWSIRSS